MSRNTFYGVKKDPQRFVYIFQYTYTAYMSLKKKLSELFLGKSILIQDASICKVVYNFLTT